MSERERWIVYPLLFLALGVALRDKLFDQTISRSIWCEHMFVVDDGNAMPDQTNYMAALGSGPPLVPLSPGGYLMVDTVRASTVIADNLQYRNVPLTPKWRVTPKLTPGQVSRSLGLSKEQPGEPSAGDDNKAEDNAEDDDPEKEREP